MKLLTVLILSVTFIIGCSKNKEPEAIDVKENNAVLGFWVSDDYSYILKINNDNTEFTFLSKAAAENAQANICSNVSLTQDSVILNCQITQNKDFGMKLNENDQLISTDKNKPGSLKRIPNLEVKDISATWKDKESNGIRTTIYVTHQREADFDLETFDIYEKTKAYNYYFDKEYKITFTEGFILTEQTTSGPRITYIVEYTNDWYRAVDQTGYSWFAVRYEGDMNKELQEQGYTLLNK
ncbi:hypothetical protein [Marinicellulosiphila megalodicopiae]|uniref:hypothetical protein n=1 Tax=Marinicellulosiphila megalodicopiae TaxID=2724896 RepID=UPI003BB1C16C